MRSAESTNEMQRQIQPMKKFIFWDQKMPALKKVMDKIRQALKAFATK